MSEKEKKNLRECAAALRLAVYQSTADFPEREWNGLAADLRHRAAEIADFVEIGIVKEGGKHLPSFLERCEDPLALLESFLSLPAALGFWGGSVPKEIRSGIKAFKDATKTARQGASKSEAGFSIR